ncbi:hypothetical protein [Alloactinosynnema sp. L-07]|uniref:hypothetical protein n=1 Tax=Alloactinosynnema sp. L-07 TaxID=1653480 RepID=UPI00065EF46F|nr:hypothetical protein [Alloactinosynnema sp. L-07]CRK59096.1 hypothetical protein [Alloactinosynnema sp. L-07]
MGKDKGNDKSKPAKYGAIVGPGKDGTHNAMVVEKGTGKSAGFSVGGYPSAKAAGDAVKDVVDGLNEDDQQEP